ncbi:Jag-like protein [Streptomyces sp. NBRC 110611]|uniref:hypothetical protein n=1 Tax=Streptomyces sp. NBRC 110611 TaxID=1621259 RepID=UPI000833FCF5|nr:hypothetical protein [Streptomyces sp. NBRC 110611]GAU69572.1 Jag-like protein [Streptomyces sp. NBRC 110611]
MDEETETATKKKGKRIDLSVAQVAGSALAAAIAAYLAGQIGMYGTVLGAGVVSILATTGGSIFQHLFRRTGEQIKEASAVTRPKPHRSSSRTRSTTTTTATTGTGDDTGRVAQDADPPAPTRALPTVGTQGVEDGITSVARTPGPDPDRTQLVPRAEQARRRDPANAHPTDRTQLVRRLDDATMALGQAAPRPAATAAMPQVEAPEELSTTTYGTRLRGWKRPALGALAVFALAMGGVTATELLTDQSADGRQGATTLSQFVGGGGAKRHQPSTPQSPGPGRTPEHGGRQGDGDGSSPDPGTSGDSGTGTGAEDGKHHGTPTPTPSDGGGSGDSSGGGSSPDPKTSPSPKPSPGGSADGGTGTDGGSSTGGSGTGGDGGTGTGGDATGGKDQGTQQKQQDPQKQALDPGAS